MPELGGWLADLRRSPQLTEVSLPRFTLAETGEQVAAIREGADPELVAALHERSGGNPYYTELLLSAADPERAGGAGAPPCPEAFGMPSLSRAGLLTRPAVRRSS